MGDRVFEFLFARPYRLAALPFGVTPSTCNVCVGTETLVARFGLWRADVLLDNISHVELTGPYLFVKTAGPARLTFSDHGLTFATNSERGVCLHLREPIPGIEPTGRLRHPNLTLTVADLDGLMAAVQSPR